MMTMMTALINLCTGCNVLSLLSRHILHGVNGILLTDIIDAWTFYNR